MSHRHLTLKDRTQIELGVKQDLSNAKIGKLIGISKSTVSRERSRKSMWLVKRSICIIVANYSKTFS